MHRGTTRGGRRGRRMLLAGLLAVAVPFLGACDTDELLEVDLPGIVPDEALSNPALAATLVNGVIADSECAWDDYVAAASHHSDEWIQASGNGTMKRWGNRRIEPDFTNYFRDADGCGAWGYPMYINLHTARVQANTVFEQLTSSEFTGVANLTTLQAKTRLYGAFAEIALGEGFCDVGVGGTAVVTPAEMLRTAEGHLTEALTLAGQAGLADVANAARVGLARVKLDLGDFQGAIDAASSVPMGFTFAATRDATAAKRFNTHYQHVAGADQGSGKHASLASNYHDLQWKGVDDPRVVAVWDGDRLGFDFVTPHWTHTKITSLETPVNMASWREAQLFIAEAQAQQGNLAAAIEILNGFHTRAGIPPVTAADLPTQDAVIAHVIQERQRELFVEGGHRLNDMLRFRGTQFEIPFLGEPGSIHPNGVDQAGGPYGPTTCFPRPNIEELI